MKEAYRTTSFAALIVFGLAGGLLLMILSYPRKEPAS
jgi:hypothetical protein